MGMSERDIGRTRVTNVQHDAAFIARLTLASPLSVRHK